MHYKLLGFSQHNSVRHFVFQRVVGYGTTAAEYTVIADVALARTLGITLQELPSLCSRLLEARPEDSPSETILLTDANLRVHAANLSAAQKDEVKGAHRSRRVAVTAETRAEDNFTPQDSIMPVPSQR
jgi:hypothetical protein